MNIKKVKLFVQNMKLISLMAEKMTEMKLFGGDSYRCLIAVKKSEMKLSLV
jgi:hypothetical protein